MRAVILAAGRGSRMGPLTSDRPKCLIEIGGASLLDRQISALRQASITEVAVVTGWQRERFVGMPLRLFDNPRWRTSSMVDSLVCAEEWLLNGTTIVCYGDIAFSPTAVEAMQADKKGAISVAYDPHWAALWSRRFDDPLADAETFRVGADGAVIEIGGKPCSVAEVEGQYMGLLKLKSGGWRLVKAELAACEEGGRRDMTAVLGRLVRRDSHAVRAVPAPGPWHEFDSPHDVEVGQTALAQIDRLLSRPPRRIGQ